MQAKLVVNSVSVLRETAWEVFLDELLDIGSQLERLDFNHDLVVLEIDYLRRADLR